VKELRGVIFDLDGTLVSSRLDFPAIKREIGCPQDTDVLVFLKALPEDTRREAMQVIHRHELLDAQCCDWMPGARAFVEACIEHNMPMAIVTRNSHRSSRVKIERNAIPIDRIVTREDSKPKPDPTALLQIAHDFGLPPHDMLMVGDYRYDLEAGRNANMKSCLINYAAYPIIPIWRITLSRTLACYIRQCLTVDKYAGHFLVIQLDQPFINRVHDTFCQEYLCSLNHPHGSLYGILTRNSPSDAQWANIPCTTLHLHACRHPKSQSCNRSPDRPIAALC